MEPEGPEPDRSSLYPHPSPIQPLEDSFVYYPPILIPRLLAIFRNVINFIR
jgi:hypothetical protein